MASVLNFNRLSEESKKTLKEKLSFQITDRYSSHQLFAGAFLEDGYMRVPFAFGKSVRGCITRAEPKSVNKPAKFCGRLRDEQLVIFDNCRHFLESTNVVLLVSFAGFGKTIVSCALAAFFKLKTLVVVNRLCLLNQWKNSIKEFCNTDAIIIEKDKDFENEQQFSVVNICRLKNANLKTLKQFHLVVLDETHLLFSKIGHQHLMRLVPHKLIGLTATDWRYDGLDTLFKLFYSDSKVERKRTAKEEAKMTAVRIQTNFVPVTKKEKGKMLWSDVLTQSATDEERNQKIVNIVKQHANTVFIVLVKRIEQVKILSSMLCDENVACLTGPQRDIDSNARIIIGTTQKLGTGFDFPRAGGLILAADVVQYVEQYIGRVMRRLDSQPLIFDFYDSYKTLQKHFEMRDKVYGNANKKTYDPCTNKYI
jgi:superfamily II DNA or RNA helicase